MIKRIFYCDRCGARYDEAYVKQALVDILYVEDEKDKQLKWSKDLCPACAKSLSEHITEYLTKPESPTIMQGEGELANTIAITSTTLYNIYYTTDGTNPAISETRQKYEEPFEITSDCTVIAVVEYDRLFSYPAELECKYTPEVDTPVITCENNLVSIVGEEDSQIYYTTDGSEPTEESILYTGLFSIIRTVTVKAFAIKDGKKSAVSELECHFDY